MISPIFPPEIEQVIFVNALEGGGTDENALNLLLIAKRVHTWCVNQQNVDLLRWEIDEELRRLIPELMRTIAIRSVVGYRKQRHPARLNITSLKKYGTYTRNLFIWVMSWGHEGLTPEDYLAFCPNVTNLVLWIDRAYIPRHNLANLPLTHLSINLDIIQELAPDLVHLLSKITHIEIPTLLESEDDVVLKYFTSLTHLAVPAIIDLDLLPSLLADPQLKVLILLDRCDGGSMPLVRFSGKVEYPRVVQLVSEHDKELEEWLLHVNEGCGMWDVGDYFVAERRREREALKEVIGNLDDITM